MNVPAERAKSEAARRRARLRNRRHNSARRPIQLQSRTLMDVVARGAVVRRHRFVADLALLLPPAVLSGVIQCAIYVFIMIRASRSDWHNIAAASGMLMVMPIVVSALLAGLRSREFPFTLSAVLTVLVFNGGVVVLSALRIPISYTALAAAAPIAVTMMVLASSRLKRTINEKLAILDFPGASRVANQIGGDITIIDKANSDLRSFEHILIDGAVHHSPGWNKALTKAQMRGTNISPWYAIVERKMGRVTLDHFDISHLSYSPSQVYYTRIKRFLDILLVVLVTPVVVPVSALLYLYIKVVDGGPALFVQTRRGYEGRNFRMLKFRSMRIGMHGGATVAADKRILPGFGWIRLLRLDELPQLINIVRGEMSWIGPRPVSISIAQECEKLSPAYNARYLVLPGITGWAQVQYGYASTPDQELEKLGFDLYYLKNISLDLDLEITFRTIRTLVTGKGAL